MLGRLTTHILTISRLFEIEFLRRRTSKCEHSYCPPLPPIHDLSTLELHILPKASQQPEEWAYVWIPGHGWEFQHQKIRTMTWWTEISCQNDFLPFSLLSRCFPKLSMKWQMFRMRQNWKHLKRLTLMESPKEMMKGNMYQKLGCSISIF